MQKRVWLVLLLALCLTAIGMAETLFPPLFEFVELGDEWSEAVETENPDYAYSWWTTNGTITIDFSTDSGAVVTGEEQLQRLLDSIPDADNVEWSTYKTWSDYLEMYLDNQIITYSLYGEHYMVWAGFRIDYYPTMVMLSVSEVDWSDSWVDIIDLIREF